MNINTRLQPIQVLTNIFVQTNSLKESSFLERIKTAIEKISLGEVGKRLIKKIGEGKHPIIIYPHTSSLTVVLLRSDRKEREVGSAMEIGMAEQNPQALDFNREKIDQPFFIVLAHELIHAYHWSYGKNRGFDPVCLVDEIWSNNEEFKTIQGFPSKKPHLNRPKITENAIRKEHGLPPRCGHLDYNTYLREFVHRESYTQVDSKFGFSTGPKS